MPDIRAELFRGTFYEIGRARARGLGRLPMPEVSPEQVAFAIACRDLVARSHPGLVDMFEGMAAEASWDPDAFLCYYFARRQGLLRGCTNVAVTADRSTTGRCFVGRNYDWAYADLKHCGARVLAPEGFPTLISYTHHWVGHPDCLSDLGLFVAISSLPADEARQPGWQWNLLVDAVALTCSTVDEAVEFLRSVPHLRAITYLLADAEAAAAVEAFDGRTQVRRPADGIVVATNHAVGVNDGTDRTRHSIARYDTAMGLPTGELAESDLIDVLRDPVCTIHDGKRFLHPLDHVPLTSNENWGTIWSSLADPGRRTLRVAEGRPNDQPFETVVWT